VQSSSSVTIAGAAEPVISMAAMVTMAKTVANRSFRNMPPMVVGPGRQN
jgi:hypothetical protein